MSSAEGTVGRIEELSEGIEQENMLSLQHGWHCPLSLTVAIITSTRLGL